ncbi:hypothetical protein BH23ACT9_BH23ACT9_25270 [soil metagenome]
MCTGCGQPQSAAAFGWRDRVAGRRRRRCRDCDGAYQRRWYAANAEAHRARARERRRARREVNAEIIAAAKAVPCTDCGQRYETEQMDFDHVRGTKRFDIGAMRAIASRRTLLDEIAKCDVVCANCHRMRTFGRLR